jgi:type I restriction enzyme S subunit
VVETKDDGVLRQQFLPFIMTSEPFHAFAIAESKGSVNPYVNWSDIERYEFALPPLDEQKRIANFLWAVERERRSVVQVAATADRVRSMTRSELFKLVSAPAVRFDSICSIPSQNGVTLKKSERAGDVPMVNMGEMFRGEVISDASDYERVVAPDENFFLAHGDLLFARRSIVFEGAGACCLVPELEEPYTFESSVIRSRVIAGVADPRYVLHFFRSDRGRDVMSQIVRRGPVSGIAGSDLRTLELPLPDLASQLNIVGTIERVGSAAPYVRDRIEAASVLQQTLVADIFGGN